MADYKFEKEGFKDSMGNYHQSIVTELIKNDEALLKQSESLDEYKDTHEKEELSPQILYLMHCFRRFIGYNLSLYSPDRFDNNHLPTVLDVGCGISPNIPVYFREMAEQKNAIYIGLDPFPLNAIRNYFFINGMFEGLHKFVHNKFDCAVFSTSLDHFPDLEAVKHEIYNIIKPGGLAIFWVGLHDPEIVAEQIMSEIWRGFPILSLKRVFKKAIGLPMAVMRVHHWMLKRQDLLLKRQPLDNLHFHYFMSDTLDSYMKTIGKVVDYQSIEKTNCVFYAIQIPKD